MVKEYILYKDNIRLHEWTNRKKSVNCQVTHRKFIEVSVTKRNLFLKLTHQNSFLQYFFTMGLFKKRGRLRLQISTRHNMAIKFSELIESFKLKNVYVFIKGKRFRFRHIINGLKKEKKFLITKFVIQFRYLRFNGCRIKKFPRKKRRLRPKIYRLRRRYWIKRMRKKKGRGIGRIFRKPQKSHTNKEFTETWDVPYSKGTKTMGDGFYITYYKPSVRTFYKLPLNRVTAIVPTPPTIKKFYNKIKTINFDETLQEIQRREKIAMDRKLKRKRRRLSKLLQKHDNFSPETA